MDLVKVQVIGNVLAGRFPLVPKQLILLAVMRVLREHEAMSAEELQSLVQDEMERFQASYRLPAQLAPSLPLASRREHETLPLRPSAESPANPAAGAKS